MEDMENILILKTNVKKPKQVISLESLLSRHSEIEQWSIDLEDVDSVLRIVSKTLTYNKVTNLLKQLGYFCCELEG